MKLFFPVTGIAVADMLLMLEYIPYVIHRHLWTDRTPEEQRTFSWTAYVWFHSGFSNVIHTVSNLQFEGRLFHASEYFYILSLRVH